MTEQSLAQVNKGSAQIQRPPINKVILLQCLLVIVATLICWLWKWDKPEIAYSVLLGGFIFIIPNAFFAWRSFMYMGAAKARMVAQSFYRGQATKFLLTAILFAVVFNGIPSIEVLALFVSYGLTALLHFIATALVIK